MCKKKRRKKEEKKKKEDLQQSKTSVPTKDGIYICLDQDHSHSQQSFILKRQSAAKQSRYPYSQWNCKIVPRQPKIASSCTYLCMLLHIYNVNVLNSFNLAHVLL